MFGESFICRSRTFNFFCVNRYSTHTRSCLEVLGLEDGANKQEIKEAYLKLSKEFHPDVNKSLNAKVRYQQIREAYDELQTDGCSTSQAEGRAYYQEQTRSDDSHNWKRRTEKKKNVNDWLKNLERESRENKLKFKAFNDKWQKEANEASPALPPDYLEYEKRFIDRMDGLIAKVKDYRSSKTNDCAKVWSSKSRNPETSSDAKNPVFSLFKMFLPWYARWILSSAAPVIFVVAFILIGEAVDHVNFSYLLSCTRD